MPYRDIKFYHGMGGCVLFMFACCVLSLGLYSTWFTKSVHEYVWGGCTIAVAILGMLGLNHMIHMIKMRSGGSSGAGPKK